MNLRVTDLMTIVLALALAGATAGCERPLKSPEEVSSYATPPPPNLGQSRDVDQAQEGAETTAGPIGLPGDQQPRQVLPDDRDSIPREHSQRLPASQEDDPLILPRDDVEKPTGHVERPLGQEPEGYEPDSSDDGKRLPAGEEEDEDETPADQIPPELAR